MLAGSSHADAGPAILPARVVVVAVPGLRWADLSPSRTPHLWAFGESAARGLLSVKSARGIATCSAASATLGAGNRAIGTPALDERCPSPAELTAADVAALKKANRREHFGTQVGALATALDRHGLSANVTVVWQPQIYRAPRADRSSAVQEVDADTGRWLALAGPHTLVAVVGAGDDAYGKAGLRVAMVAGTGFTSGRLTSDSTGRTPYVELIDVAPTVLAALRVPRPASMAGQPMHVRDRGHGFAVDVGNFLDRSKHADRRGVDGGRFQRLVVIGVCAVSLFGAVLLLLGGRSRALRPVVEFICYAVSALPLSAYTLNGLTWWRWSFSKGAVVLLAIDVVVALLAYAVARRRPPWGGLVVIAALTATLLAADVVSGTHLQLDGLLGDSTTVAGRFHGAGNTDFAVFATSALLLAGVTAAALRGRGRTWAVAAAVSVGSVAIVLDGMPMFGDDFGGVLALAPALVILALLVAGVRVGLRWWLAAAAAALAVGLGLIGYDLVAGGGHIGRFAGQAGSSGARVTIDRKLAANLRSWHGSDYVAVVAFGVVASVIAVRTAYRRAIGTLPTLGASFAAVAVCAVVGGAVNDSGVVVPGAAALVAVPLLLAGCLRAQT